RCVRHSWNSAGTTLRWARSPVAPNRTKAAGSGTRSRRRPSRSGFSRPLLLAARRLFSVARRRSRIVRGASFFAGAAVAGAGGSAGGALPLVAAIARPPLLGLPRMTAELVAQRGQHLAAVGVVLARPEAGLEGEGDDRRRDVPVDRLLHGPAA